MSYPKDPPERFSTWQWCLHYTGVSRIVYEPVWEKWRVKPNGYHPLLWVILLLVWPFMPLFTPKTLKEVFVELREVIEGEDELAWELWETDDDGTYKYLSYEEATRQ
jgi:hypothetical protein